MAGADRRAAVDDEAVVELLERLQPDWELCSAGRLRFLLQVHGVRGVSEKRLKKLKSCK